MEFYFAPLEGITGYLYRNAFEQSYGGVKKYFTPFLTPHTDKSFNTREKNDVLPEHNEGLYVVPQILTNCAEDCIRVARDLQKLGYEEINLNLGCPSGTVVSRGRGAGFLAEPKKLDAFLEQVVSELSDMRISVKTRIGVKEPEEFETLLSVYNRYPLEELIIHPRVREDYYKNKPNWEIFEKALQESKNPVCYNGDIFTMQDYQRLCEQMPE